MDEIIEETLQRLEEFVGGEDKKLSFEDMLSFSSSLVADLAGEREIHLISLRIIEQLVWEKEHPESQERPLRNAEKEARAFLAKHIIMDERTSQPINLADLYAEIPQAATKSLLDENGELIERKLPGE